MTMPSVSMPPEGPASNGKSSPENAAAANSGGGDSNDIRAVLAGHFGLLQVAAQPNTDDRRLLAKVLLTTPQVRRQLTSPLLAGLLSLLPAATLNTPLLAQITAFIGPAGSEASAPGGQKVSPNSPLGELYLLFLVALHLLDRKEPALAAQLLPLVIKATMARNCRSLDLLLARAFYFYGRAHEALGTLPALHNELMLALRQTALRHECETHAVIYNLLLRLLILEGRMEEARKLVARSPFPAAATGGNQARYHYYVASIQAVQGGYAASKDELQHALRKAPHGKMAFGFLQAAHKLLVVVQLLMGEIPERELFHQAHLRRALQPYLALTQAVRLGDLSAFQGCLKSLEATLEHDRTLVLARRLHHSVLTAGLKRLAKAYSRIPLAEISQKLGLASPEDATFVLLKAIREGVIEGQLDADHGFLRIIKAPTPYYTTLPQEALNERICTLNALHDDCLRSMRYPQGVKRSAATNGNGNDSMPTEAELMEEYLDAEDDMGF